MNLDTNLMLGKRAWALACPSLDSVEKLALLGMGIYATNTVAARIRHADSLNLSETDTLQALRQCVKESVKGHGQAMKMLKEAWMENRQTSEIPKLEPNLTRKNTASTSNNRKKLKTQESGKENSRGTCRPESVPRRGAVLPMRHLEANMETSFTEVSKHDNADITAKDEPTAQVASSNGRHRMVQATSVRCNDCGHEDTWCVCYQLSKRSSV